MDTPDPPEIRSVYEADPTVAELQYLFWGAVSREQYEQWLELVPDRTDAVGLYQLFMYRNQPEQAQRYLAMLDEQSRRDLTMADLLLGDGPRAGR